jgi:hypothetical protein
VRFTLSVEGQPEAAFSRNLFIACGAVHSIPGMLTGGIPNDSACARSFSTKAYLFLHVNQRWCRLRAFSAVRFLPASAARRGANIHQPCQNPNSPDGHLLCRAAYPLPSPIKMNSKKDSANFS